MWVKTLLLLFVFSFLFRTDHSFDQDLGRHLKLGEIITQTGSVPKTNLFSYTNGDFPFINTHWLFEVLVFWANQTIGIQSLIVLKILIILLSVWLTLKIIPKENAAFFLPVGFIFLHVIRERAELRPEIFSFLFTSVTYYILEKYIRGSTKLAFLLPLIQLLWINTHIYFFVGLILQSIFLIQLTFHKLRSHLSSGKLELLAFIFILSVFISLINPHGLSGLLYPLNVTKNYGYTIVENQTMFLLESINFRDPNFLFVKLAAALIVLSLTVSLIRRKFHILSFLLSLIGMTLALLNVRSFPYLVFLSLPAVLQNFGVIRFKGLTFVLSLVTCTLLLLESFLYLNGSYYKYTDNQHQVGLGYIESGKGAMDFVLSNNLTGPIFNNFDIGSYILYRGYPKYQVFSDGRPEAYPAQFFTGIYIPSQSEYKNFKEVEKLYGFKTIIFSHTDQTPWGQNFLKSVVKDAEWRLVYVDDFMVVLTKPEVVESNKLTVVDLSQVSPNSYQFNNHLSYLRLAVFLINNNYSNGIQFVQKALQINPDSPYANTVLGNLTGQTIYTAKSKNLFFW